MQAPPKPPPTAEETAKNAIFTILGIMLLLSPLFLSFVVTSIFHEAGLSSGEWFMVLPSLLLLGLILLLVGASGLYDGLKRRGAAGREQKEKRVRKRK